MQWQDLVLTIGSWILNFSLIPTIRGKQKPALTTSLLFVAILSVFVFTYLTLGFILTAISVLVGDICWVILAFQRFKQPKK